MGITQDKKGYPLLETFIIVLLIFASEDTYLSAHENVVMLTSTFMLVIFSAITMLYRQTVSKRKVSIIILMTTVILISNFANHDFSGYSILVDILIATCVTEWIPLKEFWNRFCNIIVIVSLISLLFLPISFSRYNVYFDEFFYVERLSKESVPWGFRLYGFFREPGMFSIYLCLALFFFIFVNEKLDYGKIAILFVCILLTGSTTGIIVTGIMGLLYLTSSKSKNLEKLFALLSVPVLIALAFKIGAVQYFIEKVRLDGANAASSGSRYFSVLIGGLLGLSKPLWGWGAVNSQLIFKDISSNLFHTEICWANMITYLFASYGFLFIFLFLRGIYCNFKSNKITALFFLIVFSLLLCGETMTYSAIPYTIMLYGFGEKLAEKELCT